MKSRTWIYSQFKHLTLVAVHSPAFISRSVNPNDLKQLKGKVVAGTYKKPHYVDVWDTGDITPLSLDLGTRQR
jgi:hypothetical protein